MDNTTQQISRWDFFVILLIGFVDYLGIGLVYPIFAVLLFDTTQGILPVEASAEYRGAILGILIALTPISQFFASPLLGAFSDLKGRKPALYLGVATGFVGYCLATMGIIFNSIFLLFLYRILVGIADATAAVAQATLADISTEKNKAKRFAILNSSLGLGFTVGPFLGGVVADPSIISWFGYTTPFIVAGILCLSNFVMIAWKFPETCKIIPNKNFELIKGLNNIRKVFLLKNFQWLFIAGFSLASGWSFFNEFIPLLLRARFAFPLGDIGTYYAISGFWYAVGAACAASPLIHKYAPGKSVIISLSVSTLCMLSYAFISTPLIMWCTLPLLMGSLACAYPTATTIVSNRAGKNSQGEVLGVYQSLGAAAMGLIPLLAGPLVGAYPILTSWGGAFFIALASFAFWKALPKRVYTVPY